MIFDELSRVSVMCTACGKLNAVLATEVHDESPLACSKCGATIGVWGELKTSGRSACELLVTRSLRARRVVCVEQTFPES